MTAEEFNDWFSYHHACFTGIGGWLDKATSGSESPTRKAVLSGWARALRNTSLQDAKAATDAMHSGRESEPVGYDRHPAAIAAIARKMRGSQTRTRQTYHDGQPTFRCATCQDFGWVLCWSPLALSKLAAGDTALLGGGVAVVCSCEAGDGHVTRQRGEAAARYDMTRWCVLATFIDGDKVVLADQSNPAQQALAAGWLERHAAGRVQRMPNYESSFEEFA